MLVNHTVRYYMVDLFPYVVLSVTRCNTQLYLTFLLQPPYMQAQWGLKFMQLDAHQYTLLSEMMPITTATLIPYARQSLNRGQHESRPA